jgi:hypothetical protein
VLSHECIHFAPLGHWFCDGRGVPVVERGAVPFEVRVVAGPTPILEVVYPAEPTHAEVASYLLDMKRTIDAQGGSPWMCLVDQRGLVRMDGRLLEQVSALNAYARLHGMICSARIVASSAAASQAHRIAEQARLGTPIQTFATREEALDWLHRQTDRAER